MVRPFNDVRILFKDDIILMAALTCPMAFGNSCSIQLVNFAEGSPSSFRSAHQLVGSRALGSLYILSQCVQIEVGPKYSDERAASEDEKRLCAKIPTKPGDAALVSIYT